MELDYRVNAGVTLRPFTMLLLVLFVVADIAGQPNHQSLVFHLGVIVLIGWSVLRIRLISQYRTVSFQHHSLVFLKRTIDSRDIRHITLNGNDCCFKIVFRESLIPVRFAFSRSEQKNISATLRQWAARNHVEIRENGRSR